jgi:hypothetical protein
MGKKRKHKPTVYRRVTRPAKPADVLDVWGWESAAGEMRQHEAELTAVLRDVDEHLKRKDLNETDRASMIATKETVIESLADVRELMGDSEDIAKRRMDFDIALDILCKAWDNQVLYPHAERVYAVFAEGNLHEMQLIIAIRSVGCYHGFQDWDTEAFYMQCPDSLNDVLNYIEDEEVY